MPSPIISISSIQCILMWSWMSWRVLSDIVFCFELIILTLSYLRIVSPEFRCRLAVFALPLWRPLYSWDVAKLAIIPKPRSKQLLHNLGDQLVLQANQYHVVTWCCFRLFKIICHSISIFMPLHAPLRSYPDLIRPKVSQTSSKQLGCSVWLLSDEKTSMVS